MSAQSLADEQKSRSKKISQWADMIVNPKATQVRAPSLTPDYSSIATIVKSFDVDGSSSLEHTIVVAPDPVAHIATSSTSGLVTLAAPVSMDSSAGALPRIPRGSGVVKTGILKVTTQDLVPIGTVNFISDLAVINPALSGLSGVTLTIGGGFDLKASISFPGHSTWFRLFTTLGGVATYYAPRYAFQNAPVSFTEIVVAGGCNYVGVQIVTAAGFPYFAPNDVECNISLETTLGIVPYSAFNTTARIASSTLLDENDVNHVRCTSLKVLVTNMASELESGGEVVTCRSRKDLLLQPTTLNLMTAIKALPEQNIWRSGNIREGAFVFYLPDDIESYEPRDPRDRDSDNLLYVCLKFAKTTGIVRIIVTSTWEYYTPRQIISRALNYMWDEESRAVFEKLVHYPACSENPAHTALIAAVMKGVKLAQAFYTANSHWINPLAAQAASHVVDKVLGSNAPKASATKAQQPQQRKAVKQNSIKMKK